MKLKITKPKLLTIVAILIIGLMLFQIVASGILQAVGFMRSEPTELELPSENIIDYELTKEQELYLLRAGKTVLRFSYSLACTGCVEQKAFLESATNQFSDQLILEELISNTTVPMLVVTSFYGERILTNATNDMILDTLCQLMTEPPVVCVRRGV